MRFFQTLILVGFIAIITDGWDTTARRSRLAGDTKYNGLHITDITAQLAGKDIAMPNPPINVWRVQGPLEELPKLKAELSIGMLSVTMPELLEKEIDSTEWNTIKTNMEIQGLPASSIDSALGVIPFKTREQIIESTKAMCKGLK